jgi:hypothetical protein
MLVPRAGKPGPARVRAHPCLELSRALPRRATMTVRVLVMLDLYFVSVKYVFVKCKACVCLCEAFENLKCK